MQNLQDDSDEDDDRHSEGDDDDDDDDDEDLFDSDEEEMLSKPYNKLSQSTSQDKSQSFVGKRLKGRKRLQLKSKSKTKDDDDDDDAMIVSPEEGEEVEDDDDDDDDDSDTPKKDISKRKSSHITSKQSKLDSVVDDDEHHAMDIEDTVEIDDSPEAVYEDYLRLQTRRFVMLNLINEPYFDKIIQNTFVRIFIGKNNGIDMYMMAEVIGVIHSSRSYKFENKHTDVKLVLAAGDSRREFRPNIVSNSRITEYEFKAYVTVTQKSHGKLLTVKVID